MVLPFEKDSNLTLREYWTRSIAQRPTTVEEAGDVKKVNANKKYNSVTRTVMRVLDSIKVEGLEKGSILNYTFKDLATEQGQKVLSKVLIHDSILNEKKGLIQNIGTRINAYMNELTGRQKVMMNQTKDAEWDNPKTVLGAHANAYPEDASKIKKFVEAIQAKTDMIEVSEYDPDTYAKVNKVYSSLNSPQLKMAFGIQLFGGFRPHDLAGVTIDQIDFDTGKIHNVLLKSGGKFKTVDFILGDAELTILKEGTDGRPKNQLIFTESADSLDKAINTKLTNEFPQLKTRVGGIEKGKDFTQRFFRKLYTDALDYVTKGVANAEEIMEVKMGRAAPSVMKKYKKSASKLKEVQSFAMDVAKSIAGYSGFSEVGDYFSKLNYKDASITGDFKNDKTWATFRSPVSLPDIPDANFRSFLQANNPEVFNTIFERKERAYYDVNEDKPTQNNRKKKYNTLRQQGQQFGPEASGLLQNMQDNQQMIQDNQKWENYKKRVAKKLGIAFDEMNTPENNQLILEDIKNTRAEQIEVAQAKLEKVVKTAGPTNKSLHNKLLDAAEKLGVDPTTPEGKKAIRKYLKSLAKGTGVVGAVTLGPGIIAGLTSPEEYESGKLGYYGAIAAEVPLNVFGLTGADVGIGTAEDVKEYTEQKEKYLREIDEKTAQQQRRRDALRVIDTETNLMLDMQNNINNNQQ